MTQTQKDGLATYHPPFFLRNSHLQTIYPSYFRRTTPLPTTRHALELGDGDFIEYDHSSHSHPQAIILCHGLESSSRSRYMQAMSQALADHADIIALNFRGCSGKPNRLLRSYHSGDTEDLRQLIEHIIHTHNYRSISLVGFSLGGNVVLKYLGESSPHPAIQSAAAISVPCDLTGSAQQLSSPANTIYMRRFIKKLCQKIRIKNQLFPHSFDQKFFDRMTSFAEFDEHYTAPVHGFDSAKDYWQQSSSIHYLAHIKIPTLLINALDDPFLSTSCYPQITNPQLTVLTPSYGGHVGFITPRQQNYWHEEQVKQHLHRHR